MCTLRIKDFDYEQKKKKFTLTYSSYVSQKLNNISACFYSLTSAVFITFLMKWHIISLMWHPHSHGAIEGCHQYFNMGHNFWFVAVLNKCPFSVRISMSEILLLVKHHHHVPYKMVWVFMSQQISILGFLDQFCWWYSSIWDHLA